MRKQKLYTYNPESNEYEVLERSWQYKVIYVSRLVLFTLVLGSFVFIFFHYFVGVPAENKLLQDQKALASQYQILSKQLDQALLVLDDIQLRDDKLYRVILQGEPISVETRHAAFENVQRYNDLMELPDADLVISTTRKMDLLNRQLYIQSNSLDELVELSKEQEDKLQSIPAIQPISNKDLKRTASGYGWRIDPVYKTRKFHEGMDFSADTGTPIFATGNGKVVYAGWKRGYGNTIDIDHGYDYLTRYAHLSKIEVRKGNVVKRGEEIGLVGNTGKSTGPHLHYEVRLKDRPMNPVNYYFLDLSPEEYDQMVQLSSNQGQVMD